jgi:hypothetical protein
MPCYASSSADRRRLVDQPFRYPSPRIPGLALRNQGGDPCSPPASATNLQAGQFSFGIIGSSWGTISTRRITGDYGNSGVAIAHGHKALTRSTARSNLLSGPPGKAFCGRGGGLA